MGFSLGEPALPYLVLEAVVETVVAVIAAAATAVQQGLTTVPFSGRLTSLSG